MTISVPFRNPLCVALDVDTKEQALKLADMLKDITGGFKLGPRLIHRYGAELSLEIAKRAPLFVDCKFFDISSTMLAAIQAAFDSGASLVTIHALSGPEAMTKVSELEKKLNQIRPFRILVVTILTSWDQSSFTENFKQQKISEHVLALAKAAQQSGLNSLVCSPQELALLAGKGLFLVTPGIRSAKDAADDQKRTMTASDAISQGANIVVVGRPIIQAADPLEAAKEILLQLKV
jgi:orotidine-5'-phosphate decarboxylase